MTVRAAHGRPSAALAAALIPIAGALCLVGPAADASARVARPSPDAEAAIVVDGRSGEILWSDRPDERHQIASATKLMTALLALERTEPGDVLSAADYDAAPVESQIGLRRGERMRSRDLLTALMLESANDAAATFAKRIAGSRRAFVTQMNRRARELSLDNTSYSNPIGFDSPRNHSSARDLTVLARTLLRDRSFAATVDRPRARLRSGSRRRTIRNRNTLVGAHPFVEGVKTGHTQRAGYVLVGAGEGKGVEVVSAVLGAPNEAARNEGTLELLRYGLDQFRRVSVARAGRAVARRAVVGRGDETVAPLTVRRQVSATLRRGRRPQLRVRAPAEIEGPLPAGREVGTLEVRDGERIVRTAPLVTAAAVPEPAPLAGLLTPGGLALVLISVASVAIVVSATVRVRRQRRRRTSARPG